VSVETPIVRDLTLNGGARLEVFDQFVESASPFENSTTEPVPGQPHGHQRASRRRAQVHLADGMNLRLSYGMTMVRPQVRQLAPYQYYDFQRDRNTVGDPELDSTRIHNVDARWEWFFSESERVTVSAFYKELDGFIYAQILNAASYSTVYRNAGRGYVAGGEVEVAVGFERIHQALRHFSLYWPMPPSCTRELELVQDTAVPRFRTTIPVPGQAPFVFNLSLRFDEPVSGFSAAIVYNVVGPRVTDVGVRTGANNILPNIRRMPFHQLDFVASWQANEHLKLKLKFKNMFSESRLATGQLPRVSRLARRFVLHRTRLSRTENAHPYGRHEELMNRKIHLCSLMLGHRGLRRGLWRRQRHDHDDTDHHHHHPSGHGRSRPGRRLPRLGRRGWSGRHQPTPRGPVTATCSSARSS
jgi:outer membrane receptor protein involved in Fe transport